MLCDDITHKPKTQNPNHESYAGARVEQQDLQPIVQTGSVRFFEALLIDIPFLVKATLIAIIACLCAFVNLTTPAVTEETIFYTVLFPMPATPLQSKALNQSASVELPATEACNCYFFIWNVASSGCWQDKDLN